MKKGITNYLFYLPMVLILLTHQLVFSQKPLTQIELLEKKRQEALVLAQNAASKRQKIQEQLACKRIYPRKEKQEQIQQQTCQLTEKKSARAQKAALERQKRKEEQAHQRMLAQQEKQRREYEASSIELLEKKRQEALVLAQNAATERQKVQERLACKGICPRQEKQEYRQPQTAQLAELKKEQAALLAQNTALKRQTEKEERVHQRMFAQQEKQREREEKACKQQECVRQFQEMNCVQECGQVHEERGIALTLKNAYFYPQEKILREIFDRKGNKGGYWVEGALRYNCWRALNVEVSGSYFKHKGFALCAPECTEVKIPTLGFGLKYFWHCSDCCMRYNSCWDFWKRLSFFLGAGLRVFFYRERNYTMAGLQSTNETKAGGMINGGIEIDLYKGLFIDLFVDYNFKKLSIDCKDITVCCAPCSPCKPNNCCKTVTTCCLPNYCFDIHIGGIVAGIGLGYKF